MNTGAIGSWLRRRWASSAACAATWPASNGRFANAGHAHDSKAANTTHDEARSRKFMDTSLAMDGSAASAVPCTGIRHGTSPILPLQ